VQTGTRLSSRGCTSASSSDRQGEVFSRPRNYRSAHELLSKDLLTLSNPPMRSSPRTRCSHSRGSISLSTSAPLKVTRLPNWNVTSSTTSHVSLDPQHLPPSGLGAEPRQSRRPILMLAGPARESRKSRDHRLTSTAPISGCAHWRLGRPPAELADCRASGIGCPSPTWGAFGGTQRTGTPRPGRAKAPECFAFHSAGHASTGVLPGAGWAKRGPPRQAALGGGRWRCSDCDRRSSGCSFWLRKRLWKPQSKRPFSWVVSPPEA
jgi:hypothetical protein